MDKPTPFTVEVLTGGSPFVADTLHEFQGVFAQLQDIQQQLLNLRARFVRLPGGANPNPSPLTPATAMPLNDVEEHVVINPVQVGYWDAPLLCLCLLYSMQTKCCQCPRA